MFSGLISLLALVFLVWLVNRDYLGLPARWKLIATRTVAVVLLVWVAVSVINRVSDPKPRYQYSAVPTR